MYMRYLPEGKESSCNHKKLYINYILQSTGIPLIFFNFSIL